jgi:hypothetical protein
LIIIKENYAWCMKQIIILQGGLIEKWLRAYLRVQVVDPGDSGFNVTSMDGPAYFYARLDRFLFKGQLDVRFSGEPLRSPRISFTDQVVHDDKVDVSARYNQRKVFRLKGL